MDAGKNIKLKSGFDLITQTIENSDIEFWYARDLMEKLGYPEWQNFAQVIQKAKVACEGAGVDVDNHFSQVGKMVDIGSKNQNEIEDIMLTRYAY
jgi:DNA-damage-inducible protein D